MIFYDTISTIKILLVVAYIIPFSSLQVDGLGVDLFQSFCFSPFASRVSASSSIVASGT